MAAELSLPPLAAREHLVDDTITASAVISGTAAAPPDRARVVVVGGGIIGASVLYHLVENGISDAVLVERHRLTSGTTWHPAGLYATVRATHALTELAHHSAEVYASLAVDRRVGGSDVVRPVAVALRAERVVAHGPAPRGFLVHGAEPVLWTAYVNGGHVPRGAEFARTVEMLAERAGVDTAPLAPLSPTNSRCASWRNDSRSSDFRSLGCGRAPAERPPP